MTGKARIDEVVRLIDEALAAFAPDLSKPDDGYEHDARWDRTAQAS